MECYLHTCDACVITTWRLGLRAPLVARNNKTGPLFWNSTDAKNVLAQFENEANDPEWIISVKDYALSLVVKKDNIQPRKGADLGRGC